MEKYPFSKCLNPKRIINPYTRESLVVECGRCPACSLRKSSLNAMKVKLESLCHKYKMFVTLTYNNVSLPRMMTKCVNRVKDDVGEIVDTGEQCNLIDITQRLGTQGTFLGHVDNLLFVLTSLPSKVNLPSGILPHLSKYDAQLFIKRLRKNLDYYFLNTYGKKAPQIRYYLVGEYGPVHFRPHYHVILWFEDDEVYKVIRQILYKSWKFGRIDCQTSQGKCVDYVAKYLNSSVSLPNVFKCDSVRPFCLHSAHLGEKVFETTREEIYENEFERVISKRIPYFSTDSDVFLWRSLKAYFFPKCKGYSSKSERQRLFAYSTFLRNFHWTGTYKVSEQARIILNILLRIHYHQDVADDLYYYDDEILQYFKESAEIDFDNIKGKDWTKTLQLYYERIYSEIRLSSHFHRFVCQSNRNSYHTYMRKIDEFWSKNDMMNLNQQYELQADFVHSEWYENEDDFQFFYDNFGFDSERFKNSKAYKCFAMLTSHNSEIAVKHKKLNDANKIFENK